MDHNGEENGKKSRGGVKKQTKSRMYRRHKDVLGSIRKKRKEDGYAARRQMAQSASAAAAASSANQQPKAEFVLMNNLAAKTQTMLKGLEATTTTQRAESMRCFAVLMMSGVPPLFDESDSQYKGVWHAILSGLPHFVSFISGFASSSQQQEHTDGEYSVHSQVDAAFALRFIASMDRASFVIQAGALPKLVGLLQSGISDLQMQAAWCLGNIASESRECCAAVNEVVSLAVVLPHIRMSTPFLRRAAVWLLRSLLDYQPTVPTALEVSIETAQVLLTTINNLIIEKQKNVTPTNDKKQPPLFAPWRLFQIQTGLEAPNDIAVVRYLRHRDNDKMEVVDVDVNFETGENVIHVVDKKDLECLETTEDDAEVEEDNETLNMDVEALTISDAMWTLVELCNYDEKMNDWMKSQNSIQQLLHLLFSLYKTSLMYSPVLRLCGIYLTSSPEETSAIDTSTLPSMFQHFSMVLLSPSRNIREEACWLLSNLASSSAEVLQLMLNDSVLIGRVVEQLRWAEPTVKREALWVICNLLLHIPDTASSEVIKTVTQYFVSQESVFDSFYDLMDENEPELAVLILETVESMLRRDEDVMMSDDEETIAFCLEESGMKERMEQLCYADNSDINQLATQIIDTFFDSQHEQQRELGNGVQLDSTNGQETVFSFQPSTSATGKQQVFNFGK